MNGFDIVAAVLMATGLALGIYMGIIRAVLGAAAVGVGGVVAVAFAPRLVGLLTHHLGSPFALLAALLFVYATVLAAFAVVAWVLRRSLGVLGLSWLDRMAGATVGLTVTLVLSATCAYALLERVPDAAIVRESLLAGPLAGVARFALSLAPTDVRRRLDAIIGSEPHGRAKPTRSGR